MSTPLGPGRTLAGSVDLDPPRVAVVDAVTRALAEDLLPLGDLTAALVPVTTTRSLPSAAASHAAA